MPRNIVLEVRSKRMDFIKKGKEFDLVGFGEVMLRLSPQNKEKISQSEVFEKNAGGSELNVVSGAAVLGVRSAIITKLPESKIGHFIRNKIRYGNVSDDYVVYDTSEEKRLGIYYYESGAYPRKSSVIYDRAASSMTTLSLEEIDPDIYDKTGVFHISSISLALNEKLRETAVSLIKNFHAKGVAISFDVNYRASLWSEEEARKTIESVLPYVDILFVSEETSRRMFQKTGTLEEIMKSYCDEFGCKLVATTQRVVKSPTRHNFSSKVYYDGQFYEEKPYENIEVVDRIGSGDAYVAGMLYGLIQHSDVRRAVQIGNAMAAVKNTVNGDMCASSIGEIEGIIKAHTAEGVQSEMDR